MPHSHHSHSGEFCRHAKDTLEEVIQEAIRQGFETFGLSEHAPRYRLEDLFPEEADLTPQDLLQHYQSFLTKALSLRSKYSSQINLLIGIETDYITPLDLSGTSSLLETHPEIDYIVGSVHHVRGVSIDFDRETWLRAVYQSSIQKDSTTMRVIDPPTFRSSDDGPSDSIPGQSTSTIIPKQARVELTPPDNPDHPNLQPSYHPTPSDLRPFLIDYLEAQYTLIKTHQPEVIGHFDLCKLWVPELDLEHPELQGITELVDRNIREVIGYGGLFEANAASLRKGWNTSYPGKQVLDRILKLGGRICLSDDSHGVGYVGLNYQKMREYLIQSGVHEIWYLLPVNQRKPGDEDIGNRKRVVARKMTEWKDHPFWRRLEEAQERTTGS